MHTGYKDPYCCHPFGLCGCYDSLACPTVHLIHTDVLPVNPLTTNDTFWRCLTLATCYQLAQSVLVLPSIKGGIGGGGKAYYRHVVHMVAALACY